MAAGALLLAADAFDDKHRTAWGPYQTAEVVLVGVLIVACVVLTVFGEDD
jgi:hypothetical protein